MRSALVAGLVASLAFGPAAAAYQVSTDAALTLVLDGEFEVVVRTCAPRTMPFLVGAYLYREDATYVDHRVSGSGGFARVHGDSVLVAGETHGETTRETWSGACDPALGSWFAWVVAPASGRFVAVLMGAGADAWAWDVVPRGGGVTVVETLASSRGGALGVERFEAPLAAHVYSVNDGRSGGASLTVDASTTVEVEGRLVGGFFPGWPTTPGHVALPDGTAAPCGLRCDLGAPLVAEAGPAWTAGTYGFHVNGASLVGPGFLAWADAAWPST